MGYISLALAVLHLGVLSLVVCLDSLTIEQGEIIGKSLKTLIKEVDYYGYFGIPFAEPPIGDLRFKNPIPHRGWSGVFETKKRTAACVQFNQNVKFGAGFGTYGVEDCLQLDVFTPCAPQATYTTEPLPVIVFLFNNQFKNSYNKTKDYAPDFFIEEEIVFVTISHRLSMFGFLGLENEAQPGNAGLRDIILGLQWVKDNIKYFNGDPNKVTLMGASGGATAVDILIHSKPAKGLFSAAILQGGSSRNSMYFQLEDKKRAYKLADAIGVKAYKDDQLLNSLSKSMVDELLNAEKLAIDGDYYRDKQRGMLVFGPTLEQTSEDSVISMLPEHNLATVDIPIMAGFNSKEGLEGALQYLVQPAFLTYVERNFDVIFPLRTSFHFEYVDKNYLEAEKEIRNFYFTGGKVKVSDPSEYVTYLGDVVVSYSVNSMIRDLANKSSQPVYYYYFDNCGVFNENGLAFARVAETTSRAMPNEVWETTKKALDGAAAQDELCYLLRCPKLDELYRQFQSQPSLHHQMITMWANFAKYRNPMETRIMEDLEWKPYTADERHFLYIGEELSLQQDLLSDRMTFWDSFMAKYEMLVLSTQRSKHLKEEL